MAEKRSPRAEALQLLGLARRAGTVVLGTQRTRDALRSGEAALVVVAEDASAVQLSKIEGLMRARAVPRACLGDRVTLGGALGGPPVSAVALGLALSGSFAVLAVTSAVARLVTYTGACAATLRLRHQRFRGMVTPATFVIPMGGLVPLLAIGVSLLMLVGATRQQLLGGAAALAVGAALFLTNDRFGRRAGRWPGDARSNPRGADIRAEGPN